MATRTIYFVRHGEYDFEAQSPSLKRLTGRGKKQAQLTGKRLRSLPATFIYSSDLIRAVETAEIIRRNHEGIPYEKRRNLRECVLPSPFVFKNVPEEYLRAGQAQADAAFSRFLRPARGHDKHEIIVAHGNLIRYLISRVLVDSGYNWSRMGTNYCGISKVVVKSNGRIRLITYNDTGHLPRHSQT